MELAWRAICHANDIGRNFYCWQRVIEPRPAIASIARAFNYISSSQSGETRSSLRVLNNQITERGFLAPRAERSIDDEADQIDRGDRKRSEKTREKSLGTAAPTRIKTASTGCTVRRCR